tara:strand:+ start:813 stop:1097 length:285 start_codon:yes stop_codon:yes gene_type:complete
MISEILKLEGWKANKLKYTYEDSSLKWLNAKASEYHTIIDSANESLKESKYLIKTLISGSKKNNHYKLKVKITYYDSRSKHEHKKNTHRQKINI